MGLYVGCMLALGVHIDVWRDRSSVESVRVAPDFGAIVRSDRLADVLRGVVDWGGTVIAAICDRELRGYASMLPSSALIGERWHDLPDTFELGSIEVSRSARGNGIGTGLLAELALALPVDRLLVFARGFASHWDTGVTARAPIDCRRTLLRMLARVGFQAWETDDPEVNDHPLNFLAVRAGLDAPSESVLALTVRSLRTQ